MATNGSGWQRVLWSGRSGKGKALVIVVASVIVFGVIGALSDSGSEPGSTDEVAAPAATSTEEIGSATTTEASAPETTTSEEPSSDCVTVPADLVAALQEGFTVDGTSLRNAYAVKSNDLENAWYISGDLEGPGLDGDDEIATWAKGGDLEVGGGLMLASNEVAREFSDWGAEAQPGSPAAEAASMDNHGAEASQDCVRDS